MDVEHACVSEILLGGEMGAAHELRLKPEFFTDPEHRKTYELILDHFSNHRKVPSIDAVHAAYPNYPIDEDCEEPLDYYVAEVRDRYLYRKLRDGLAEVVEEIVEDNPAPGQRAFERMSDVLINARMEVPVGQDEDVFAESYDILMDEIRERQQMGFMRGVDTGFEQLNLATGGLQPEQLITVIGLPATGKSTMLLHLAHEAVKSGNRSMLVTFEMSIDEQRDRLASLMAQVPLSDVLSGQLMPDGERRLKQAFSARRHMEGYLVFVHDRTSMTTLSGVQAKINEYKPKVLFIDGVYMMDDEHGEPPGSPRALTNITRGLKRMAQRNKIAIVVSTQALAQKSRGGVNMHSAGYSSSFAQDSDVILIVESLEEPNKGVSKFFADKVRSGPKATEYVRLDWGNGRIEAVDPAMLGLNTEGLPGGEDEEQGLVGMRRRSRAAEHA